VTGGQYAGGLVASNRGNMTGCTFAGSIESSFGTVGGLAGYNDGLIVDCEASGRIQGGRAAGGLVGVNNGGTTILRSRSTADVTGGSRVGGIVGDPWNGYVVQCCSYGSVAGNSYVGGLIGYKPQEAFLKDSYSRAAVSGKQWVGGLAGFSKCSYTEPYTPITHCFFAGALQGTSGVSALVAVNQCDLIGCFWDKTLVGVSAAGADLSSGKTTDRMQKAATFTIAGWDFVGETKNGTADIWWIDEGMDYPRLSWELHN
jgi:hypothetical protein